jgi:hypothetical protein
VVGQRLKEVVTQVPPQGKAVGRDLHKLPLGTQALEEHDQLQLEEDRRVHRRATAFGVERSDQLAHEREV